MILTILALLAAGPVHGRDVVSMQAAKMQAMLAPDTLSRWPAGGFDGTTLVVFGTAADATNAIAFNETAGCITFEGSAADASEARFCGGTVSSDQTLTFGAGSAGITLNSSGSTPAITLDINDSGSPAFAMQFDRGNNRIRFNTSTGGLSVHGGGGSGTTGLYFFPNSQDVGGISANLEQTPDNLILAPGTLSNSIHIAEKADIGFDFQNGACATSACADPALTLHSRNQSTSEWAQFSDDGISLNLTTGAHGGFGNLNVKAGSGGAGISIQSLANSGFIGFAIAEEQLTLNTGATTTDTSANLLPANALILAVMTRVTTTITTAVSFSVGDPTTGARFSASAGGMAAGSTRVGIDQWSGAVTTLAAGPSQAAAAKIRITTNANPGAGVIRIQVVYAAFVPPSS